MAKPIQLLKERERILLENAKAMTYCSVEGGKDLRIHFYFPKDLKEQTDRPVLLFFHGGAWDRGSIVQFAPHALYYVERGAVCGLVEYRHQASHSGTSPVESLQDGKAAIQFVRYHAEEFHIDGNKVVVVGASAGANIAAGTAMNKSIPPARSQCENENSRPNGTVLISSIIDIEKGGYGFDQFSNAAECRKMSLSRQIRGDMAPMLMIHGTADRCVPYYQAAELSERMKKKRAPFQLVEFEGRDQNFFNYNTDPVSYEATLAAINDFLDSNGILEKGEEEDCSRVISWREDDY